MSNAVGPPQIDVELRRLFPYPNNRRAILELFDNRVTWSAVKHWRKGRRGVPTWARECMADKLQAKADELAASAARARAIVPGPGFVAGARNLAAWHARKKEEAGNKADP